MQDCSGNQETLLAGLAMLLLLRRRRASHRFGQDTQDMLAPLRKHPSIEYTEYQTKTSPPPPGLL